MTRQLFEMKLMTRLPRTLLRQVRIAVALEHKNISEIVRDALVGYLAAFKLRHPNWVQLLEEQEAS